MKAFAIGIVFFAAVVAFAGDVEEGDAAILKGDYVSALKKYLIAAEKGDAKAQNQVGNIYFTGSEKIPKNYREAIRWYKLSVDQGNADSQTALGFMHQEGIGVLQDYVEAARLYKLAAAQGHGTAQSSLGFMYWEGNGVPHDLVRAHMWMNLSAANSDNFGLRAFEVTKNFRESIAKALTPKQISQAQMMARQCQSRSFKNCD